MFKSSTLKLTARFDRTPDLILKNLIDLQNRRDWDKGLKEISVIKGKLCLKYKSTNIVDEFSEEIQMVQYVNDEKFFIIESIYVSNN